MRDKHREVIKDKETIPKDMTMPMKSKTHRKAKISQTHPSNEDAQRTHKLGIRMHCKEPNRVAKQDIIENTTLSSA